MNGDREEPPSKLPRTDGSDVAPSAALAPSKAAAAAEAAELAAMAKLAAAQQQQQEQQQQAPDAGQDEEQQQQQTEANGLAEAAAQAAQVEHQGEEDLGDYIDHDTVMGANGAGEPSSTDELVHLNVGGKHFTTTRSTLESKQPQSLLAAMVSGRLGPVVQDYEGRMFIDRSGELFDDVLGMLRDGTHWQPPLDRHLCRRLAAEVRHYQLELPQGLAHYAAGPSDYLVLLEGRRVHFYDSDSASWGGFDGGLDRRACGATAVGSCVYAFGGEPPSLEKPYPTTVYDLSAKSVRQLPGLPTRAPGCSGVSVGGRQIFCLGGASESAFQFNFQMEAWMVAPDLPEPRSFATATEHGGCVYLFGGRDQFGVHTQGAWRLDPRTKSWAALPQGMPVGLAAAASVAVGGRLFVAGGLMKDRGDTESTSLMQCYDVVAGRWDTGCAPLPQARDGHAAAVVNGEVWVVGGQYTVKAGTIDMLSVPVYSPASNSWRRAEPLPCAMLHAPCVQVLLG